MLRLLKRKAEKENVNQVKNNCSYPLELLKKYIGRIIEVNYIEQDIPRIEKGILVYEPNPEFFYLGQKNEGTLTGYHSVCWDRTDSSGKRSIVCLIMDDDNKKIYENNSVCFDYSKIIKSQQDK